ncbi:TIR domain-containing protein [Flavobacterium beibuense]|uniref:TIR domain-containing protein n=1 Tax=Flavobacterium beibuense TaxID=657326 RepID=UPI00068CF964|nr:TIR domain-containing protein [Flavobacterium beibuense]
MNWLNDFYEITNNYIKSLQFKQNKTTSKFERDQKKYKILIYSFGLEGKIYDRNEISILLGITVERVRQVLKKCINEINQNIYHPTDLGLFGNTYESIIQFKNNLEKEKVLSYYKLSQEFTEIKTGFANYEAYINLLFEVLNFKLIKIHLHHLKDNTLLITSQNFDHKKFINICYTVYLIIEKNVIPLEENDLIIKVRKSIKSSLSKEEIFLACNVINSISKSNNCYFISFEKLSTLSDMAFRILFEKGDPMKATEILKEINHRLLPYKKKRVDRASLNSQMNSDSRLSPIGKSGYWSLKEWNETNKSIYELITEGLTLFNTPLTKKEITNYIVKERPNTPTRSIDTVIYDKRFLKIKGNKFILDEWKDIYKDDIIITQRRNKLIKTNPISEQINEQIKNLFIESNSTEILLSTIVKTLNKKFDYPKASIYKIISENLEYTTTLIGNTNTRKIVKFKAKKSIKPDNKAIKPISVFISYSWENEEHKAKTISFIDFLRKKGFEADLDIKLMQEETSIDFNRLMHSGILKYDKIIVILSSGYKRKAENFEGGVGKEYKYILSNIDNQPKKYILASFETINIELINKITPIGFSGREIVDLVKDEKNNFQTLFSKLTNTGVYKFSDVASNTPSIETNKIEPFTLKK